MKPYSSYKDSGIAWIGQIPSHWDVSRVASLYTENTSKNTDNEFAFAMRFNYGTLVDKNETGDVSDLKDTYSAYTKVKKNDVVINGLNLNYDFNSHRVAISPKDGIITSAYIIMTPRPGTNSTYYNYLFKSMDSRKIFHGMGTGIRLTLSFAELKKQALIIPPVDEQATIVRFITEKSEKIDRYIAEQERLLATLDELRQAEIARAVTRGLNPDAPLRDSGIDWIGSIPAHWEKRRYKDILSSEDEKVGDNPITLLSLSKNGGIIIRDLSENKGKFPKDFATYKIVRPGNLVMCLFDVDETPRTVGLSHHHGMITGAYDIFSIRNIDSRFLEYHLLEIDNRKAFKSLYKGLRKTIPTPSLLGSYIYIPPLDDQQAIVEYLDAKTAKIDSMKADIQRQIGLLKEYKQRIIADAVTGKIDVRE